MRKSNSNSLARADATRFMKCRAALTRRLVLSGIPLILAGGLSACSHQSSVTNPSSFADLSPLVRDATEGPYHIGVGDEVEVKFFFTPELNDRLQVRPDGKVSIMFAQDMQAAGKTAQELSNDIREVLKSHVKQPDLVVVVRSFASQKVFVGGEVTKPGPVLLTGRENILQILGEAGWLLATADHNDVILIRRDPNGKEGVYQLNLKSVVSGEDMSQNVLVQPGDLILVPPSDSISADRWVDQNIRQIMPFSLGAYYDLSNIGVLH